MSLCLETVHTWFRKWGGGAEPNVSSLLVSVVVHQEVGAYFKVNKQKVISASSHHWDKHRTPCPPSEALQAT